MPQRLIAAIACVLLATAQASPPPVPDPSAAATLARAYAQFGFNALGELRTERPNANVFISPTSIAIALAMVTNGSEDATRAALLEGLGLQNLSLDAINSANQALIAELSGSKTVQLAIANALWLQPNFPVNPDFQNTLQTTYRAQTENVDFRSTAAPATINAWAAKHTNDRVQKIVEEIDPSTVVMLTNAVAFKGKWTLPFDKAATQPHDFTTDSGAVHKVPMMQHSASYEYASAYGIEAIRLPYADESFAMYVVLPQDADTMTSFLHELTAEHFTSLLTTMHKSEGTIELPRFTISYDATLNRMLEKLGMGIAFGNAANFEGIHKGPPAVQISEVRHASFLKVDEEGTEAAAVTSVGMRTMAMRPTEPPFHMIVDRPFFLVIRDESSGQILFTGTIGDPG